MEPLPAATGAVMRNVCFYSRERRQQNLKRAVSTLY